MTELIWEGKYDEQGRKVAPPRIALPFQTVETVNESAADRERMQDLFAVGRPTEWRNRLIWGDKKYVLPSLLQDHQAQVDLIYIDPPFDTGANFSYAAAIPDDPETAGDQSTTFTKQPSAIEQKAYRDTWGKGLDSYLKWFFDTATLLRELLADSGSVYVHLDHNVGHYAKVILDEVFGRDRFLNEIVWKRSDAHNNAGQGARFFGRVHDTIFVYTKSERYKWNTLFTDLPESTVEKWYRHVEEGSGRRFNKADLTARKAGGDTKYEWRGVQPPAGRYWAYSRAKMEKLDAEGRLVYSASGMPYMKRYLDESKGVSVQDLWTDISMLRGISGDERLGYATQKPEALLRRILEASTSLGDLVLDCFAGSGTTAAVAEKMGRRWITCDLGRFAVHTTRKRLLAVQSVRPFVVQNLGKYERQAWQVTEFGPGGGVSVQSYRAFILALYGAQPMTGHTWLHGIRGGRMVHVGSVDAPVTMSDVAAIAVEFKKAVGSGKQAPSRSGVDVLGWDFAFELNETAKQQAELAGIDLRLVRIPREVLEKKAVEQGDIKFYELAALRIKERVKARTVTLELTDFVIPLDDVPEDVQKAVTHWEQWIDYWAVDWDNSDDTFHNEWQSYRTRKEPKLARQTSHRYPEPGSYRVVVKVIDILGNDTTKVLQIEVG
ncbi:MAG: hypothetical protein IT352_18750 [Gemmatimonadales bacterium]|nr:hypothetical protein [Gemmatimonadales bacterium]